MGSANSYDDNASPAKTDKMVGIDDPAGSWAIQLFTIAQILGLIEASDIPEAITVGATGSVNIAALPANVQTFGGIAPSANVQSLLGAATYAAIRALLDLEAGTDFYSISAADAAFEPAGVTESDITDLGGTVTMNADTDVSANGWVIDEDTMATDSATKVPTQQSVKAYTDNKKLDDLAAPDDNTDLNVSTTAHGLCPKAPNETDQWLRGDGTWQEIPYKDYVMTVHVEDLSSPGWAYLPVPYAGNIRLIQTVLESSITVTDAGLTFYINGVAITGGTITITQAGSAAGDYDYCEPTALNAVVPGDVIRIYKDGASTGGSDITVTFTIER